MNGDEAAPAAPPAASPAVAPARPEVEALWQRVEEYRPYLKALAEKVLRQNGKIRAREDASDVVQKALERGYAVRTQFAGDTPARFRVWLAKIVQNVALNTIRAGKAGPRDVRREAPLPDSGRSGAGLSAGSSTPSRKAAGNEEIARLLAALERLPSDEQEVVRLHALEGLSYEQVAERLGATKDVVRGRWKRGFDNLRALLRRPA
jgi:RNA polymerase sigma-70 factor, ECF subfamily